MGKIARYLGVLTVEQRDRVVTGRAWNAERVLCPLATASRCLVGHVVGGADDHRTVYNDALNHAEVIATIHGLFHIGDHFDRLWYRFGGVRVVRAIKLRAAKLNGCDAATIERIVAAPTTEQQKVNA